MPTCSRYPDRPSGGSYTPPEDMQEQPAKFILREKISEMMRYALPIIYSFPRKDRPLASKLRNCMYDMMELVVKLELKEHKKTAVTELDAALQILREYIKIASDREFSGPKYAPPLTVHQRDVWGRYNSEIGRIIGGYKKSLYK